MADGHRHDLHGCLAGLVAALVLAYSIYEHGAPRNDEAVAAVCGVLIGTWLLSPDLDMWGTRPIQRWWLLRFLWAPYSFAFGHRGISHGWILGPITRLIYIGIPIAAVCFIWQLRPGSWASWGVGGIVVGNWVHLLGDGILPFQKSSRG